MFKFEKYFLSFKNNQKSHQIDDDDDDYDESTGAEHLKIK